MNGRERYFNTLNFRNETAKWLHGPVAKDRTFFAGGSWNAGSNPGVASSSFFTFIVFLPFGFLLFILTADLVSFARFLRKRISSLHIFITLSPSFHGFITNQFNDLLPVGFLAQIDGFHSDVTNLHSQKKRGFRNFQRPYWWTKIVRQYGISIQSSTKVNEMFRQITLKLWATKKKTYQTLV